MAGPHCCAVCWQGGGGDSVGAVADLAKDFVIVHNEIQTLRKEVGEMKKALTGLSSMQSEHLAALQSGKRSNSMVRYTPVALSLAPWGRSKHALCSACLPGRRLAAAAAGPRRDPGRDPRCIRKCTSAHVEREEVKCTFTACGGCDESTSFRCIRARYDRRRGCLPMCSSVV